ncbi:hypothetical protein DPX16_2850 [Anabarilius grahami]|uniref:Uncharacterized protein n=1 Tax=Anabarilius grahami TaxID=495550 RepID=A0A3N0YWX6_ANAGA|nr:hypothetical protein DPX16_2850 [Anabarilius grahami]
MILRSFSASSANHAMAVLDGKRREGESVQRTSTVDLHVTLASPGQTQSFPKRIANLLHTSLFLGTAGLRPLYKYLLSFSFMLVSVEFQFQDLRDI